MNESDRQAMMHAMMEQFFGGVGAEEKKEMLATMMGKMTEGMDMKEMMPTMMMGMMSGGGGCCGGESLGGMPGMMSGMQPGGAGQPMPEMMLKMMMPHCIGMMLPAIDPDKRGEVAATLLSAIVEKGAVGMTDEQRQSFLETLGDVLNPPA